MNNVEKTTPFHPPGPRANDYAGRVGEADGRARMESMEGNFLGLADVDGPGDVAILPVPYELTTSYGEGTVDGPQACIAASSQVELYDPLLPEDLPAGFRLHTAPAWDGEGDSLAEQLANVQTYLADYLDGSCFPVVLGGEHGLLPAEMRALRAHPEFAGGEGGDGEGNLSRLTLVQIDAHADLRDEMNGEPASHACAARRALDEGVGGIIQVGVRALGREEALFLAEDGRVECFPARDLLSACSGEQGWALLMARIADIDGPAWLTLDIDGLDGGLVPNTGTPVPGGLHYWQAVELIEALFANPDCRVLGADVVEIVPGKEGPLTEFTAAMLATKVIAAHLATLLEQRDKQEVET